jgi:hypothetical protein
VSNPVVRAQQVLSAEVSAAAAGTAQLGGVVMTPEGAGEQPLRRVTITLLAPERRIGRTTATDDRGRFLFADLPAGRYTISAARPGFLAGYYGATRPYGRGTPVVLAAGQRKLDVRFTLPRGAVLAGTIRDPFGEPAPSIRLQLFQREVSGGRAVVAGPMRFAQTDGRGQYRFWGLPPGEYLVATEGNIDGARATPARLVETALVSWAAQQADRGGAYATAPPPQPPVVLSRVFFPGTTDIAVAAFVTVGQAEERLGVDFALQYAPVARVSGRATLPDGRPAPGTTLLLIPDMSGSEPDDRGDLIRNRAVTTAQGEFEYGAVEPGRYLLVAQASSTPAAPGRGGPGTQADLWLRVPVTVDGKDIDGLAVSFQPGMTIAGRVVIERDPSRPLPSLQQTRVALRATKAGVLLGSAPTQLTPEGGFAITGVSPGEFLLTAALPEQSGFVGQPVNWMLKSIVMNGRDVLDRAFEILPGGNLEDVVITFTDRVSSLSGKLIDAHGQPPPPDFTVVVFSADRTFWMPGLTRSPRSVRPSSDGAFRFNALQPGDYVLALATEFDSRDLTEPAFLEQLLASGVRLTMGAGEQRVQDLRVGR